MQRGKKRIFLMAMNLIREGRYRELFQRIRYSMTAYSPSYNLWGRSHLMKEMKNDSRFYIRDDILRSILHKKPAKYEICKIRLGDIKRDWKGTIYSLTEVSPYAYITQGDKERYIAYIKKHFEGRELSKEEFDNIVRRWIARKDDTISSVKHNGYDVHKGIIVLDERNTVWDGQHRSCVLLSQFGPDYEVTVLRIYR